MRTAVVILGKDLRQRLRDRSALLVAIVVPLVLASIFGLIFHDAIGGRVAFKFGLVDQDRGPAARAFASALGPLGHRGLITLRREPTFAAGRDAADRNRVSATFVLPRGLSDAVGHGRPATVRVLGNVDASVGTQVAQSIAQSYADRIDAARVVVAAAGGTGISQAQVAALPDPISIGSVVLPDRLYGSLRWSGTAAAPTVATPGH
jgi:ABC-2 type transport system permease protein